MQNTLLGCLFNPFRSLSFSRNTNSCSSRFTPPLVCHSTSVRLWISKKQTVYFVRKNSTATYDRRSTTTTVSEDRHNRSCFLTRFVQIFVYARTTQNNVFRHVQMTSDLKPIRPQYFRVQLFTRGTPCTHSVKNRGHKWFSRSIRIDVTAGIQRCKSRPV